MLATICLLKMPLNPKQPTVNGGIALIQVENHLTASPRL